MFLIWQTQDIQHISKICTSLYTVFSINNIINFSWSIEASAGADPGFCEGGFEREFIDSLKGTFEQK